MKKRCSLCEARVESAPVPRRDWLDTALVMGMVLCSITLLATALFLLQTP